MVKNDIFFLHDILFANLRNQFPIIEYVLHVDSLEVFTIEGFSCYDEST